MEMWMTENIEGSANLGDESPSPTKSSELLSGSPVKKAASRHQSNPRRPVILLLFRR
jgi:hypothetical protein